MVLDASLFNILLYKARIKGKMEQYKERSNALSTPQCSSSWNESLRVTLDYGRKLYFVLGISYEPRKQWKMFCI